MQIIRFPTVTRERSVNMLYNRKNFIRKHIIRR